MRTRKSIKNCILFILKRSSIIIFAWKTIIKMNVPCMLCLYIIFMIFTLANSFEYEWQHISKLFIYSRVEFSIIYKHIQLYDECPFLLIIAHNIFVFANYAETSATFIRIVIYNIIYYALNEFIMSEWDYDFAVT